MMMLSFVSTTSYLALVIATASALATFRPAVAADGPPALGQRAPDFELVGIDGQTVELAALRGQGPVVLVVLRGYPGYQCPICTRQVGELIGAASKFKAQNASVVLVYPGPAGGLRDHAAEFVSGKSLSEPLRLVLDPDYAFTNAYHLRWNAKNETAYPATFVIDQNGKIKFAKVSMTHGGRAATDEILAALAAK